MANKKFKIKGSKASKFTIKKDKSEKEDSKSGFTIIKQPLEVENETNRNNRGTGRFIDSPEEEPSVFFESGLFYLSPIIRELKPLENARIRNGAVEKIITLSPKTGRTTERFLKLFGRADRRFFINTRGRVISPVVAYRVTLPNNEQIIFHTTYEIECSESNDLRLLVESLAIKQDPAMALNEYMNEWINEIILNEGENIKNNFFEIRNRLQRAISSKAERIGLKLRVNLRLKNEHIVEKAFRIQKEESIRIQLKNLNDYVDVKYEARVTCHKPHRLNAILKFKRIDRLPGQIADYLRIHIKEYDFVQLYDGFSPEIQQHLKSEVNSDLKNDEIGWELDELIISKIEPDYEIYEHLSIEKERITFPVKTNDNKTYDVSVFNTVVLNLHNPDKAKIKWNKTGKLKEVAKEMLQRVTYNTLINTNYADLIINKGEYERQIRNQLSQWAFDLGYTINNFITIPDVELEKLGGRFDFVTDKNIEYTTKIGDKVKVQIVIQNAEVENLRGIEKYLNPNTNIVEEMKKWIERDVTNFLHDKDPNDYYVNFDTNLKDGLANIIRESLIKEFHVSEAINILPKQIPTPLIERFLKLQQGVHDFEFESFGKIKYTGYFKVNAINPGGNGWQIFKNNNFENKDDEIKAIKIHLQNCIEESINNKLPRDFKNVKDPRFNQLINVFIQEGQELIKEEFGLLIRITSRIRHKTLAEKQLEKLEEANNLKLIGEIESGKQLAEKISEDKVKRYDELKAELEKAKKYEDDDKVKQLEKELRQIEKAAFQYNTLSKEMKELESGMDSSNDTLDNLLNEGNPNEQ